MAEEKKTERPTKGRTLLAGRQAGRGRQAGSECSALVGSAIVVC